MLNTTQISASDLINFSGKSLVINEFSEGQNNEIEIEVNENGQWYKKYIDGVMKGTIEVFDGQDLYIFDEITNSLEVIKHSEDNPVVIPHPFLSSEINERIVADISNKIVKKKLFRNGYKKVNEHGVTEEFVYDDEVNLFNEYEKKNEGQLVESFSISNIKETDKNTSWDEYIASFETKSSKTTIIQQ